MHDRLVSRRIDALHQCFLVSMCIALEVISMYLCSRSFFRCVLLSKLFRCIVDPEVIFDK